MPYDFYMRGPHSFVFFFFNDTATTEIYTLSLHDALPISQSLWKATPRSRHSAPMASTSCMTPISLFTYMIETRSEEHTSELQSQSNLVCRLLLEKKKEDATGYVHVMLLNVAAGNIRELPY